MLRLGLNSFPGQELRLPRACQILEGVPQDESPLDPEQLRGSLRQALVERLSRAGRSIATSSVLLLLPDKTRRAQASRLAIDALLELQDLQPGLEIQVLFGLGTHPLMSDADLQALLGRQRLARLRGRARLLQQQTTLAPLPSRELRIPAPPGASADGGAWTIPMPAVLWDCDLILVAGNTELHPYERRGGSGGIHKMLAIGIGPPLVIRRSHIPAVLLDPPGSAEAAGPNRFVALIDAVAQSIVEALRQDPCSRLACPPLGFSLVVNQQGQPLASWVSDREQDRARLAALVTRRQTVGLQRPVSFVIADPELNKATDLLAGARNLHLLCMAHSDANPLLDGRAPWRIAVLLNPCHEAANQAGIGSRGTVDHLEALRAFRLEEQERLLRQLAQEGLSAADEAAAWRLARTRLLRRWEVYLRRSGEDEQAMEYLLAQLEQLVHSPADGAASMQAATGLLQEAIDHSWGGRRRLLEQARTRLPGGGVEAATVWLRQAAARWLFQGLGEGGQRALRLLCLLRHFDELLVVTDNPAVLDFLASLDPSLPRLSRSGAPGGRLVGLRGADLRREAIDATLEREWTRHRALVPGHDPGMALVRDPVIPRLRLAASDADGEAGPSR